MTCSFSNGISSSLDDSTTVSLLSVDGLRLLGGNGLLSSCGAQNAKLHLRDSLLFEREGEVGFFRLFGQRLGADLGDANQVFGVGLDKRARA